MQARLCNHIDNILVGLGDETLGQALFQIERIFDAHLFAVHLERRFGYARRATYRDEVLAKAEID